MLTAINVPFDEAEKIETLPDDTRLISIYNDHEEFWKLKVHGDKVHKQTFSDITADKQYSSRKYFAINYDQACEIVEFIEMNKDKNFIVNCHAGISRSAAICLFVHKTYGHELLPKFWTLSSPNPLVFGMLTNAHELHINKRGSFMSNHDWDTAPKPHSIWI